MAFFEDFSFKIRKQTDIFLDNARIHVAQKVKERLKYWQKRGLYIYYLPLYSPHLNIIERLWKELKARWLRPEDYTSFDTLKYATSDCFNQVGTNLKINYSKYYANNGLKVRDRFSKVVNFMGGQTIKYYSLFE